jgi:hypothetical protein
MMRRALAAIVMLGAIWSLVTLVWQPGWWDVTPAQLNALSGCYRVDGKESFRLEDGVVSSPLGEFSVEAEHEKGRDVLITPVPIFMEGEALARGGTLTKVPIRYGSPVRLEFFDANHRMVLAERSEC